MRIVCALKDAADKGEVEKDLDLKIADRLFRALWTEDKNTSEESVLQVELDPILPGGWEKWKYVCPRCICANSVDNIRSRSEEEIDGFDKRSIG
jgi:hypothetical protein